MASHAQILANRANAAHSTGPRTETGKAASSRNAATHGYSTGVFQIDADDLPYCKELEAALHAQTRPEGALELDALGEVRDACLRLRQIRKIVAQLYSQYGLDPLVHPEFAAAMRQLTRYRAAAEMQLYRALDAICDLQLIRVGRMVHLTAKESKYVGPMVPSQDFAFQDIGPYRLNRVQRECYERNCEHLDSDQAAQLAHVGLIYEIKAETETVS